jgi:hypothetical protein
MEITLSTREAAAAIGRSIRTAQRWAKRGKLQAVKHAGRWVITVTATVNLADWKPAQLDKAREAITEGAILPTSRPGMYTAVSSDGAVTYLVHTAACACPAGIHGRACYHRAAVAILEATRTIAA